MTDKVDSAIYIYDVEFDKIKTIKQKAIKCKQKTKKQS